MATTRVLSAAERKAFIAAVALATALAVWLRTYGITGQVVLDDEWHAIHKLLTSAYGSIFGSFGLADHSIPLTLLYKAMAETVGLAEGRLRAPQIAFGVATVPLAAWIAWRATRDAPAAALFAFLVAGAPFLVMWSRFARPYAMTPLLAMLCVAILWRWRTQRTPGLATAYALCGALLVWLHPLCVMYPALAWLFVFSEDVAAPREVQPRPSRRTLGVGLRLAGATALLLIAPLVRDGRSLTAKAGGDQPDLETYERMLSIFWGGLLTPVSTLAYGLAAWGLVVMARRNARLGAYLALLAVVPPAVVTLLGAHWVREGQNFARYVLPLQLIVLFLGSVGVMSLVRAAAGARAELAAWAAAALLSAAYLQATPAIAQVARLGPWYGHLDHHWDYRYRWIVAKQGLPMYEPPAFYRKLGRMAPGSAPLIEAPFSHAAPANPFAFYANFHRQPEALGMLHDLCLQGPRVGEPAPGDRRLRFRKFVFLNDPAAVRATGARYLLLLRERIQNRPFVENELCIDKLAALYGPPIEIDARLAVFDLKPGEPPPKLQ